MPLYRESDGDNDYKGASSDFRKKLPDDIVKQVTRKAECVTQSLLISSQRHPVSSISRTEKITKT